jgi:hypothetical protein
MSRKFYCGWLAGIIGFAGLIAFGWHWLDSGLDLCEDVTMQETASPNAHLKAFVYSRSCGVFTTGFTTQVALVKNGEPIPKEASNVYSEYSEASQPQVSVRWEGSQSLLITDDANIVGGHTWAEKQVKVNLGWFRSANVAVHYADLPFIQKTKPTR